MSKYAATNIKDIEPAGGAAHCHCGQPLQYRANLRQPIGGELIGQTARVIKQAVYFWCLKCDVNEVRT